MLFIACLAVGVAAVVGVGSLVTTFEQGLRGSARELLGGDLRVAAFRELPPEIDRVVDVPGTVRTDVVELASMASVPGGSSRLVRLKAVDRPFPLYGEILTEPLGGLAKLLDAESVVVAPELLTDLSLAIGGELRLGGQSYRVAGLVTKELDLSGASMAMGPRVFLSREGLARTQLVRFGSRVRHQAMFRIPGPPSVVAGVKQRIVSEVPEAVYLEVQTHAESQPQTQRGVRRVGRFLGLVALTSLLLGGLGVSQIVRTWLATRLSATAVLRCLGYRPREVVWMYLTNVVALALLGSLIGGIVGATAPRWLGWLMPDVFPSERFVGYAFDAFARGVALGVSVAVVFSLPTLLAAGRVSPARVLRADAEPLATSWWTRIAVALILGGGLFGASWAQATDARVAAIFAAGFLSVAGLLMLGARALVFVAGGVPRTRLHPYIRHGIAALARPSAGTTGALVALGLGVGVVVTMKLVETRLASELRSGLSAEAPSAFLLDVQPTQWPSVREVLERHRAVGIKNLPLISARLVSVDGRTIAALAKEQEEAGGRRRWVLTREQRLTVAEALPPDNRILEGALWCVPEQAEVSLERGFANDLGCRLGSKLVFDVQGVAMEFLVSSLRSVEWESFDINFFLVAEPGYLDAAPQSRIAVARLDPSIELDAQREIIQLAPNVSVIRIREALDRVTELLERLSLGVRVLGSFTILTGLIILGGAIAATTVRRARETALLKTLGVTRAGVAGLLAFEYGLLGFVAGTLGAFGALGAAQWFLRTVLELEGPVSWVTVPTVAVATAGMTAVCGLAASIAALRARPMDVLRCA